MKNTKIILIALFVITAIGSAFAYKTSKFGTVQLFFQNPNNPKVCDQPSSMLYKPGTVQVFATTVSGNSCTILLSTNVEQ